MKPWQKSNYVPSKKKIELPAEEETVEIPSEEEKKKVVEDVGFKCPNPECDRIFKTKRGLSIHISQVHPEE